MTKSMPVLALLAAVSIASATDSDSISNLRVRHESGQSYVMWDENRWQKFPHAKGAVARYRTLDGGEVVKEGTVTVNDRGLYRITAALQTRSIRWT